MERYIAGTLNISIYRTVFIFIWSSLVFSLSLRLMFLVLTATSATVSLKNFFTNVVSLSICVKADDFFLIAFQS